MPCHVVLCYVLSHHMNSIQIKAILFKRKEILRYASAHLFIAQLIDKLKQFTSAQHSLTLNAPFEFLSSLTLKSEKRLKI